MCRLDCALSAPRAGSARALAWPLLATALPVRPGSGVPPLARPPSPPAPMIACPARDPWQEWVMRRGAAVAMQASIPFLMGRVAFFVAKANMLLPFLPLLVKIVIVVSILRILEELLLALMMATMAQD